MYAAIAAEHVNGNIITACMCVCMPLATTPVLCHWFNLQTMFNWIHFTTTKSLPRLPGSLTTHTHSPLHSWCDNMRFITCALSLLVYRLRTCYWMRTQMSNWQVRILGVHVQCVCVCVCVDEFACTCRLLLFQCSHILSNLIWWNGINLSHGIDAR